MTVTICQSKFPAGFLNKYNIGKKISDGLKANIFQCFEIESQMEYVVKISVIDNSVKENVSNLMKKEFEIVQKFNHSNIIKLYDYYEDENAICIVFESCKYGDLLTNENFMNKFSENDVKCIMFQLLDAINYLHNQNIVHRDIKLENICMFSESSIRLIDFEFCINDNDDESKKVVQGTAITFSPEKVNKVFYLRMQSSEKPSDIWAAGIVMYCLLVGHYPYSYDSNLYKNIRQGNLNYNEKDWANIDFYAENLVKQMLKLDPRQRITAKQALSHRYFKNN